MRHPICLVCVVSSIHLVYLFLCFSLSRLVFQINIVIVVAIGIPSDSCELACCLFISTCLFTFLSNRCAYNGLHDRMLFKRPLLEIRENLHAPFSFHSYTSLLKEPSIREHICFLFVNMHLISVNDECYRTVAPRNLSFSQHSFCIDFVFAFISLQIFVAVVI